HSCPSPVAVWATLNRSSCAPSLLTTATAWLSLAQSMPAVGRGRGGSCRTLIVAFPLLQQWEGTRWFPDTAAGRSLIGARWLSALSPVGVAGPTGPRRTHAGPRRSSEQGDHPVATSGASEPSHHTARTRGGCSSERPAPTLAPGAAFAITRSGTPTTCARKPRAACSQGVRNRERADGPGRDRRVGRVARCAPVGVPVRRPAGQAAVRGGGVAGPAAVRAGGGGPRARARGERNGVGA